MVDVGSLVKLTDESILERFDAMVVEKVRTMNEKARMLFE
jgi:hypothetical protein